MCDCRGKIEESIREQFIQSHPNVKIEYCEFKNEVISLNTGKIGLCLQVVIDYKVGKRLRHEKINVKFLYCPFCGEKTD